MKRAKPDGRVFVGEIVAEARAAADGQIALLAPKVGLFRDAAAPGTLVGPGSPVGGLEVLGVVHRVLAPTDVAGRVLPHHGVRLARRAVGFRGVLLVLDPHGTEGAAASEIGRAHV